MDLLKAGQCEEEVKMSIRRAAAREVSLSEFTVHPVPAYSKLQQYVQEMLNVRKLTLWMKTKWNTRYTLIG